MRESRVWGPTISCQHEGYGKGHREQKAPGGRRARMCRNAHLHHSSSPVSLVLWDALPSAQHSSPPFAPASFQHGKRHPHLTGALVLGVRRMRRRKSPEPLGVRSTHHTRLIPSVPGRWMDAVSPQNEQGPCKPHPTHAQAPRQPQTLSPGLSDPFPAVPSTSPPHPGCPKACTDQGCTFSSLLSPSSPPPRCDGGSVLLGPPFPHQGTGPLLPGTLSATRPGGTPVP